MTWRVFSPLATVRGLLRRDTRIISTACGRTIQKPETGIRTRAATESASSDQPRKAGRVLVRACDQWINPPRTMAIAPNIRCQKAVSLSKVENATFGSTALKKPSPAISPLPRRFYALRHAS